GRSFPATTWSWTSTTRTNYASPPWRISDHVMHRGTRRARRVPRFVRSPSGSGRFWFGLGRGWLGDGFGFGNRFGVRRHRGRGEGIRRHRIRLPLRRVTRTGEHRTTSLVGTTGVPRMRVPTRLRGTVKNGSWFE